MIIEAPFSVCHHIFKNYIAQAAPPEILTAAKSEKPHDHGPDFDPKFENPARPCASRRPMHRRFGTAV